MTETAAIRPFLHACPSSDDLSRQPTEKLVDLAATLKTAQSEVADRLRQANLLLADRCEFAAGSKTGRLKWPRLPGPYPAQRASRLESGTVGERPGHHWLWGFFSGL